MKIRNGEFHLGDCLDILRELPTASIDMVMTSPPYDGLRSYGGGMVWDFPNTATEISRVIKPGGVVVWVVSDETIKGSETGSSFRQALFFKDTLGLNLHDTMIFQKKTGKAAGSHKAYWQSFEYMFVLSKGEPKTINLIADVPNKWAGAKTKSGKLNRENTDAPRKSRVIPDFSKRNNIWPYLVGNTNGDEKIGHPAVFPTKLAEDHVKSWSALGDMVLDPFMGSGSTALACERTGRRWIGVEQNAEYYWNAAARLIEDKL